MICTSSVCLFDVWMLGSLESVTLSRENLNWSINRSLNGNLNESQWEPQSESKSKSQSEYLNESIRISTWGLNRAGLGKFVSLYSHEGDLFSRDAHTVRDPDWCSLILCLPRISEDFRSKRVSSGWRMHWNHTWTVSLRGFRTIWPTDIGCRPDCALCLPCFPCLKSELAFTSSLIIFSFASKVPCRWSQRMAETFW